MDTFHFNPSQKNICEEPRKIKMWFTALVGVLTAGAAGLWIEGAPPGRLKNFLYDLELKPGAKLPAAPQPAKQGPGKTLQEQHHLRRDLALGRAFFPDDDQIGETAARVHSVPKPGEHTLPVNERWGRLARREMRESNKHWSSTVRSR